MTSLLKRFFIPAIRFMILHQEKMPRWPQIFFLHSIKAGSSHGKGFHSFVNILGTRPQVIKRLKPHNQQVVHCHLVQYNLKANPPFKGNSEFLTF